MAKPRFLSIKDFDKTQHYKQRNPPWLKLHKPLFGDRDFMQMSVSARYLYIGLLMLASECDNKVINDPSWIAQRLSMPASDIDLTPLYKGGFLLASPASIRRYQQTEKSRDRGEAETEERQSRGEDTPAAVVPTSRRPRSPVKPMTGDVWESYRSSYLLRYGADPIRNASVNAILTRVIERLGTETAPAVASFYVQHNKPFYVEKRHPVNLLLADAEGLHTQWITGVKATTGEAKNAERRDDAIEQIKRVKAAMGDA